MNRDILTPGTNLNFMRRDVPTSTVAAELWMKANVDTRISEVFNNRVKLTDGRYIPIPKEVRETTDDFINWLKVTMRVV